MSQSQTPTDSTGSELNSLAQELAFYDDCDFESRESERHVPGVSPRAFPTEIEYDLDIDQIPAQLGRGVISMIGEPGFVLVQTFGSASFEDDIEQFEKLVDRKAYRQVNVYRLDEPATGSDDHLFGRWANYGWIVEYSAFGDSEIDDRPHNETTGYYYASTNDVTDMARTLLFEEEHDSWVLGRLNDAHVFSRDTQYRFEKQGHVAHSDVL